MTIDAVLPDSLRAHADRLDAMLKDEPNIGVHWSDIANIRQAAELLETRAETILALRLALNHALVELLGK